MELFLTYNSRTDFVLISLASDFRRRNATFISSAFRYFKHALHSLEGWCHSDLAISLHRDPHLGVKLRQMARNWSVGGGFVVAYVWILFIWALASTWRVCIYLFNLHTFIFVNDRTGFTELWDLAVDWKLSDFALEMIAASLTRNYSFLGTSGVAPLLDLVSALLNQTHRV